MPLVRGVIEPDEAEFQNQVVDLAHMLGWVHLHVRRSIGKGKQWVTATNLKGWFDLLFWHPVRGGLIAVELKSADGVLRPDQVEVADSFRAAGFAVYCWRPADMPEIQRVLSNPPGRPYVHARD